MQKLELKTKEQAIKLVNEGKLQISCRSKLEATKVCELFPSVRNDFETPNNTMLAYRPIKNRCEFFFKKELDLPTLTAKKLLSLESEKEEIQIEKNIESRLKKIIANKLTLEESEIVNDSDFYNDLGADSLDAVEIIMEIEKEFSISIKESELENCFTFKELMEHLTKIISPTQSQSIEQQVKPTKKLNGGWCVKSIDIQEYRDVMKFALEKEWGFNDMRGYYGIDKNGKADLHYDTAYFNNNILTLSELKELIGWKKEQCNCEKCMPMDINKPETMRMIVCSICGNKRCPKASNHENACTNSNEPNQTPKVERREIEGYECPMDLKEWDIAKGELFILKHKGMYHDASDFECQLPAELVEAYFTPKYKESEEEKQEKMIEEVWGLSTRSISEFKAVFKQNYKLIKI